MQRHSKHTQTHTDTHKHTHTYTHLPAAAAAAVSLRKCTHTYLWPHTQTQINRSPHIIAHAQVTHTHAYLWLHVWQWLPLKVALHHLAVGVPLATELDALLALCSSQRSCQLTFIHSMSTYTHRQTHTHAHACMRACTQKHAHAYTKLHAGCAHEKVEGDRQSRSQFKVALNVGVNGVGKNQCSLYAACQEA